MRYFVLVLLNLFIVNNLCIANEKEFYLATNTKENLQRFESALDNPYKFIRKTKEEEEEKKNLVFGLHKLLNSSNDFLFYEKMETGRFYKEKESVGPYIMYRDKRFGIEPGFECKLNWMSCDDLDLKTSGTKFNKKAKAFLEFLTNNELSEDQFITNNLDIIFDYIRNNYGKQLFEEKFPKGNEYFEDLMLKGVIKQKDDFAIFWDKAVWLKEKQINPDIERVLKQCELSRKLTSDIKENLVLFLNENEGIKDGIKVYLKDARERFKELSEDKSDIFNTVIKQMIMDTERKFQRIHYVKLDYKEEDKDKNIVTIPMNRSKTWMRRLGLNFKFTDLISKKINRMMHKETIEGINFGAVTESLANDLIRSMGIYTQDLSMIRTKYKDNKEKILLDSIHMEGKNGEPYYDLSKKIAAGYIVQKDKDNEPKLDPDGFIMRDDSIEDMGKYLILFLCIGDWDALGSRQAVTEQIYFEANFW